ncbi:MAG: hypothetical protein EOM66_06460 [Clostridia bacterium]|nr:hypothetical protein [Candidatus Pelethousia sp.]NCB31035.1 hypothetical protein [Clostridia bacterium]
MKKRIWIFALCALLCALLALYSGPALAAAREGFYLWRDSVFPALLPFFVCAHIMQNCGAVRGGNRFALYGLSMVSGAPSGARLAGMAGKDTTDTVAALNVVSPMFIAGSFAGNLLGCPLLAWPILFAQFSSAALFLILSKDYAEQEAPPLPADEAPSFLRLMSDAVTSGVASLLAVGGTIMVFMALKALLDETGVFSLLLSPISTVFIKIGLSADFPSILFSGMLEMVQGCRDLAVAGLGMRQSAAIGAFFFSFGGICILAQSLAFARLRAGRYLWRKLLQGCLAALLTYLLVPLFLPNSQTVFSSLSPDALAQNALSAALTAGISLVGVSVVLLFAAAAGRKRIS